MKNRFLAAVAATVMVGCTRENDLQPRRYREIFVEAPTRTERLADVAAMARAQPTESAAPSPADRDAPGAPTVAAAPVAVRWTSPEGWVEKPGHPMRLMTFAVGANGAECTLTAFPGPVGGLEGNLARWAGQINVSIPADELARFARSPQTFETEGGFPCLVYDFAAVAPEADPSMLAAILPADTHTIFVKLTAPRALIAEQKEAFLALCRSLRP
ncbi:MAG: hypothetical protein NZ740_01500 [Kiritimatiellae bacterium]|nr:hypothetical protein [Kiritimatiellia bacterium]MDW8457766.1 hypothetical protein [Verrucomicrobiota bacterium]